MNDVASIGSTRTLSDVVTAELAPLTEQIDAGLYPADTMRGLGLAGAFDRHLPRSAHLPGGGGDLGAAIDAMAEIAAVCMSTAFCTWCQDACGWYLDNTENHALRERLQPGIASGLLMGGTGLSNPIKAIAGLENFALQATRAEGGYVVTGVLPWVSNLGADHWFGTVFQDADDPDHKLMAMVHCAADGVDIRQNVRFSTLEGTGTYSIRFKRSFVPDAQLLADPLGDMVARIRPGFMLLQTGMGLGIVRASLAAMRRADRTHESSNRYLPTRPDALESSLEQVATQIGVLARTPRERDPAYMQDVLKARLAISELTLTATQAAMLHSGARAFIAGSPVQRRLREGYFVAMITPSTRHLARELSRSTH